MIRHPVLLVVCAFALFACSSPSGDEEVESEQGAASTDEKKEFIPAGKYVSPGRGTLLIRGRSSESNLLSDMAGNTFGVGALEEGDTIRAPETDPCTSFRLDYINRTVTVSWLYDREASSHRDPETAAACRKIEGEYDLTVPGNAESAAYGMGDVDN